LKKESQDANASRSKTNQQFEEVQAKIIRDAEEDVKSKLAKLNEKQMEVEKKLKSRQ